MAHIRLLIGECPPENFVRACLLFSVLSPFRFRDSAQSFIHTLLYFIHTSGRFFCQIFGESGLSRTAKAHDTQPL